MRENVVPVHIWLIPQVLYIVLKVFTIISHAVDNTNKAVFKALKEKGYNPVNQIVGYIMSGDPTYVTSFNGARSLIMKVERDELVEELLKAYIEHHSWE